MGPLSNSFKAATENGSQLQSRSVERYFIDSRHIVNRFFTIGIFPNTGCHAIRTK